MAGAEIYIPGVRLLFQDQEPGPLTASSLLNIKTAINRLFGILGTTASMAADRFCRVSVPYPVGTATKACHWSEGLRTLPAHDSGSWL